VAPVFTLLARATLGTGKDEGRERINTFQEFEVTMPSNVTMKALLEMGVHFGHRTQKWNPKMKPFIFGQRNGIHIIDLQQTLANIHQYHDIVRDVVANGGVVLFVGTKRQAMETIQKEAERCNMPYVNTRWLGGTMTNWVTIRSRIETLNKLEQRREKGEFELLTKKEALILERRIIRLNERLGGIRKMRKLPNLLIVVDTKRESTAVKEANTLGIPVLALADTNIDPQVIDYIIPGNDDAMRAIKVVIAAMADAVIEGHNSRKGGADEEIKYDDIATTADEDVDDSKLLGAGTLNKIKNFKFDDEE
jgi:small subunit ribosomal protein S2